ncbi:uncharacterized protein EAF02_007427 [Botrytis sinoallii]|uniref:uncharacterized protein n=1 Tax=Botrytis sinoallii TaxID=1463999 RepID=UPI0019026478|nr:uncharacterized protein EAF02_007427 [Botrytis sinoallii]KAF7880581.1 hypothetical protein EAF02_007427 [Botrytis sinoallii]
MTTLGPALFVLAGTLKGRSREEQNRENTSALLELRDIEDELNTLKTLFNNQMTEIRIMLDVYEKRELTKNGLIFLRNAEEYLEEYTQHVEKMTENAKNTRDDFDKLLGMIQRQAQVDEVRLARYQADLASAQSRSVMIFTNTTPTVPTSSALITLALIIAWSIRFAISLIILGKSFAYLQTSIYEHVNKAIDGIH